MRNTGWISSLMDVDRASEFSVDDVNQFSSVIDLKGNYEFLTVILPIMVASEVRLYIMRTEDVTEVPTLMHIMDADAVGSFAQESGTAGTAGLAVIFRIGGASFIRLRTTVDQTDDITFYVKGFNRENM